MKLAQFWYFGHVSKSLVAKSTTAMNPNPEAVPAAEGGDGADRAAAAEVGRQGERQGMRTQRHGG